VDAAFCERDLQQRQQNGARSHPGVRSSDNRSSNSHGDCRLIRGCLAGGYLIDGLGLRSALIVLGGLYVGATGSLLFNPGARDLERGHVNQDADGNLPLEALD
jgi:hypothetical protein